MSNIHGRLHYHPTMDNTLRRPYYRPRDINHILVQIAFLSLLGWFPIQSALLNMDDPYGQIEDELISRHPINYYYYYYYYFGFEIIEINLEWLF